ncbi:GNAT family N-acetyltransferase [Stenotrophomonas tumulicola]|uniref:GNAT family N-acetyltransferase n=1 Tax=Stenotrophomonas tumulicola TaxID=1685415 RepID=A0A7W3IHJ1_9GAMM|nr:GNAT family N-acetyltransferase [Stenotrophomonas tumulicola]MBA8680659.1 GNAT family N-acetyltransferase [Stenotrophomonas tumulicola]
MQTTSLDFRLATRADEAQLLTLMRAFYVEDQIQFDEARVQRGVDALLADPRNGEVLLWLDADGAVGGYAVIAIGFSLEQGGHFALLDELYLAPGLRGGGRGKQALAIVEQRARGRGVARLRLEVNRHNALARRLYEATGYIDDTRDLMTLPLDHPRDGLL